MLSACGGSSSGKTAPSDEVPVTTAGWYKPSVGVTWHWQLQGTLNSSYSVGLYDIDLFDTTITQISNLQAEDKKVICYFSGGSYENWRDDADDFPDIALGEPLDGWQGERWLDIRNNNVRTIMLSRLDLAKEKGCDGVEPDNMDGYTNLTEASGFNLTAENQLDYNRFIAEEAHKRGLSVGLKNNLNQVAELEPFFDFSVNEQCFQYDECDLLEPFITAGKPVLTVEYESSYIESSAIRENMCTQVVAMNFSTLVLPLDLDDSFRYSCH